MSTDVLTLGGVQFRTADFAAPNEMGAGGRQAMAVHKLPGGQRVIDTLGPDEDEIEWRGFFLANNALDQCLQLDAMRAAGAVVTLSFAGQSRQVLISHFQWRIRRLPLWVEYRISCTVVSNASFGALGAVAASPTDMVNQDLATADTAASDNAANVAPTETFAGSPTAAAGISGLAGAPSGPAPTGETTSGVAASSS
jgi:hypothetical protein